ncbi:MAG TPA: hypothetical protein VMF65_21735 [Acidimicrobiales bacterium]|nr:hypothetical protein [Acidimicrobiales bacterium]HTW09729.1 hypothetical protein [Acidimicrobiales bacterium]
MGSGGPTAWTVNHFSQANPEGPGQADVPALLRRVAATIDELGEVEVMDLIMHNEITAEGDRPSLTVYFHKAKEGAE